MTGKDAEKSKKLLDAVSNAVERAFTERMDDIISAIKVIVRDEARVQVPYIAKEQKRFSEN